MLTYDCLICPTYYNEGVPRVLLEAGSIGLISITTDIPGCTELIEDNFNGLICKPNDVNSLEEKISLFIETTLSERKKMSVNAIERINKSFNTGIILSEYEKAPRVEKIDLYTSKNVNKVNYET